MSKYGTVPFRYSADWYGTAYHDDMLDPNCPPPTTGDKPDRDAECLEDAMAEPHDHILICGCGGGDNAKLLQDRFGCRNLTMIDWSKPAVNYCRRFFPDARVIKGDVTALPFLDGEFTLVTALDLTEHLPLEQYAKFLRELYRVTSPCGRAAVLPGMTRRPEHVNVRPLPAVLAELSMVGFADFHVGKEWIIAWKEPPDVRS